MLYILHEILFLYRSTLTDASMTLVTSVKSASETKASGLKHYVGETTNKGAFKAK